MIKPSPELLSQVLKTKITSVHNNEEFIGRELSANQIMYFEEKICFKPGSIDLNGTTEEPFYVNVYELMYKCQTWACSQGFQLFVHMGMYDTCYVYKDTPKNIIGYEEFNCDAKTTPEVIFKACEWILNNRKDEK